MAYGMFFNIYRPLLDWITFFCPVNHGKNLWKSLFDQKKYKLNRTHSNVKKTTTTMTTAKKNIFDPFIQYMLNIRDKKTRDSKESMEEKCVKRDTDHIHKSSHRL